MGTRRDFMTKLGIGSIIFGNGGVFKIIEDPKTQEAEMKPVDGDEIIRIAGAILDAVDGRATDPKIYEFVRARLVKGTIYDGSTDNFNL